jgi:hypothetical protein
MRHRLIVLLAAALGIWAARPGAAQDASKADQYVGTWAGTWDGSGSGDFELTIEKGSSGALSGKVAVTTEAGPYTATLTSLSFEGAKMTGTYDFPLDAGAEVVLAATFEGRTATGTWSLRPKGQDAEVLGGTWKVVKK